MPIRYLILSLTNRCNLSCTYCYNGSPGPKQDMPVSMVEKAIALAVEGGEPFHLQLTGGEPTLVPQLIACAAAQAHESGLCRSMGIQTNATALTPDLMELFKTHGLQVGVSLDGPPDIQERMRGKAAETLRGLQLLKAAGIAFNVTTVVTEANAPFLDRLVLMLSGFKSARGIGLDLLVHKGFAQKRSAAAPARRPTLADGLTRMAGALTAVNARRAVPIRLRERDLILSAGGSAGGKKRSAFCHACRAESMAVNPLGEIFPCGQTMGDARFAAGTVLSPRLDGLKKLFDHRPSPAQCRGCALEKNCPGDCPSRLFYNQTQHPPQVCELYRILWEVENGRPPSTKDIRS